MKKDTKGSILLNSGIFLIIAVIALLIKFLGFENRGVSFSAVQSFAYYSTVLCLGICIVVRLRFISDNSSENGSVTFRYLAYAAWFFLACALCTLIAMFLGKENGFIGYFFIFGTVCAACFMSRALPDAALCAKNTEKADASVYIGVVSIILSFVPALGFAAGSFGILMAAAALNRDRSEDGNLPKLGLVLSGAGMLAACVMTTILAVKCFN